LVPVDEKTLHASCGEAFEANGKGLCIGIGTVLSLKAASPIASQIDGAIKELVAERCTLKRTHQNVTLFQSVSPATAARFVAAFVVAGTQTEGWLAAALTTTKLQIPKITRAANYAEPTEKQSYVLYEPIPERKPLFFFFRRSAGFFWGLAH